MSSTLPNGDNTNPTISHSSNATDTELPNPNVSPGATEQIAKKSLPKISNLSSDSLPISISNSLELNLSYPKINPEFQYNKHNESIYDDEKIFPCLPTDNREEENLVKYEERNAELVINHATIKALIVQMTSPEVIDYGLICDFFLTYRMFSNSEQVMNLLLIRLIWSLQYINSDIAANQKIGKSALLRTFVVLRHWIINYFVDDFDSNYQQCDRFSTFLDSLIFESNLMLESEFKNNIDVYIFISKIIGDLKSHWLSSLNEFWNLDLDMDALIANANILHYTLPLSSCLNNRKKLSKSNTEFSIHTNPSYRRSAMLSLYDQNTHHKMLILDENTSQEENPQFSINNLLLQHQSSRLSINNKVQEIQQQKQQQQQQQQQRGMNKSPAFSSSFATSARSSPIPLTPIATDGILTTPIQQASRSRRILRQTTKHNRMNIKDSGLDLKRTKNVMTESELENGDPLANLENRVEATTLVAGGSNETKNKVSDTKSMSCQEIGFSTSGNVKLPPAKVYSIVPPTPVKKMDYKLVNDDLPLMQPVPFIQPSTGQGDEFGRKKSIRKIMDTWKRSLTTHHDSNSLVLETKNSNHSTQAASSIVQSQISNERNTSTASVLSIGKRVDVLSARIIDELEYLIRYYVDEARANVDIIHEVDNQYGDSIGGDEFVDVPVKTHYQAQEVFDGGDLPRVRQPITTRPNINYNGNNANNETAETAEINETDKNKVQIELDGYSKSTQHETGIRASESNALKNNYPSNEKELFVQTVKVPRNVSATNTNAGFVVEETNSSQGQSFQKAASINWNDEDAVDLEASTEKTELELLGDYDQFNFSCSSATGYNQKRSENTEHRIFPEPNFFSESNRSFETSSISTPSNITQYDAEIADLGIAMSPQSGKPKRISFNDVRTSSVVVQNRRISMLSRNSAASASASAGLQRMSMKSYLSYDSAFSMTNDSNSMQHQGEGFGLRKKIGFNNLRAGTNGTDGTTGADGAHEINEGDDGFEDCIENELAHEFENELEPAIMVRSLSRISRHTSKSSRRSVRFSTLCALTELPFNEVEKALSSLNSNRSYFRESTADNANNSIISMSGRSRSRSRSSHCNTNREMATQSTVMTSSSSNSVAIPGISNYALKELAAIPDETMQSTDDPVEYALHKLEGSNTASRSTLKKADCEYEDEKGITQYANETYGDDTEAILDEIRNAHTEDAINITTFDVTDEAPLTPIRTRDGAGINKKYHKKNNKNRDRGDGNDQEEKEDDYDYDEEEEEDFIPLDRSSTPHIDAQIDLFSFEQPILMDAGSPPLSGYQSSGYQSPKIILDNYAPSNDLFSVENIMNENSHVSFVLSADSKSLANHFTLIEKDMLMEIDWKDLIELKWNKELTPVNSWLEIIVNDDYYMKNKGVNLVIARFNLMVNWIISEIILTQSQTERINIISRFIHIAQNCLILQNFTTLMQIILALTSQRIQNLKNTWRNLPPGDILMLKTLEELASPLKNFINIRLCINQITPSKGCIPFVGLYLSDLTFNAERPSTIKRKDKEAKDKVKDNQIKKEKSVSSSEDKSFVDDDEMINFSKFRTAVHIVKSLSQCIEWSSNYNIEVQPELLSKCLYIKSLDEDEMNYCVSRIQNTQEEKTN